MSGFSSDYLPDKTGLKSKIIIALRATSRHLDRMYDRALASAYTVVRFVEKDLQRLIISCIEAGAGNPLAQGGIESFCAAHELTRNAFLYAYARQVAQEFAEGSLAFWDGNRAMNQLGGAALEELDGLALDLFHAFDHGEYLLGGEPASTIPWQQYTLPEVMALLAREGLQARS